MGNNNCRSANNYLSIKLDPPRSSGKAGMYMAGSTISGTVLAQTNEIMSYAGLNLVFRGVEDVQVCYKMEEGKRTVTRYSNSVHEFVQMSIPLLGSGIARNLSVANEGQYAYSFHFKLPDDLPTSFRVEGTGGYARIAYKVEVKVKEKEQNRNCGQGKMIYW